MISSNIDRSSETDLENGIRDHYGVRALEALIKAKLEEIIVRNIVIQGNNDKDR